MMEKQILYHGSSVVVEHPLVNIGRKDLDFGPGFYLTPLIEQASQWAERIKTIRRSKHAIVNKYMFMVPVKANVKHFDSYDEEWLDFIVDSRAGRQPWKGYDIIEGGVADDRVIDAVEAYINGYADVERTLDKLMYHKPNFQICILNQEVVDDCLTFISHTKLC